MTTPHDFGQDFDRLLLSFQAIAKFKSPVRRRFELAKIAPYHGLPRSECRKLFELWLIETFGKGVSHE